MGALHSCNVAPPTRQPGQGGSFAPFTIVAMAEADHDRRMKALDDFLDGYQSEHGEILEHEMRDAAGRTRTRAVVVRPAAPADMWSSTRSEYP